MSQVHVIDHPLIQHKLTLMRQKETGAKDFRELLSEIAMLMCYEVTRELPLEEIEIETPICKCKSKVIAGKKLGVVPILRNQELHDKYHFLVDALEFLDQYRKLKGEDLLAIVGGSFGPDGGASYVEIANVDNIRRRNEEIVAAQKC